MATAPLPAPAPLSAPDCDLRGYEFMPLFGTKLFSSDLYHLALDNPRAGWAALKLWWEAFGRQCPAGSLPSDDRILARYADFGSDLRGWNKVKAIALHGFILCSDGRLYHPLLCTEAATAYLKRKKDRDRKRAKKGEAQIGQPIENIEYTGENSDGTDAEFHHEFHDHSNATGQDRTGQDRTDLTSSQSTAPQSCDAMLSITQHADPVTASAEVAAPPAPSIADQRRLMPRVTDKPFIWIGSGLSKGPDNKPIVMLDKQGTPRLVAGIEARNRVFLDYAAMRVCEAARIDKTWRGDWPTLVGWLNDGFDLGKHIVPAITTLVERQAKSERGYKQPSTLRYFTAAIREYAAARREAA